MSIYKPEDFSGQNPPPRIIATEMEYLASVPLGRDSYSRSVIRSAQFLLESSLNSQFLPNASRLYPDVEHVEYAGGEGLGPREAVCVEMAGQFIIASAADERGDKDGPLYRRTGTGHTPGLGTSLGYHQNLLTPRYERIEDQKRDAQVMGAHLATRVIWSGSGMVGEKFVFSQKAHDVARDRHEIIRVGYYGDRTAKRNKPLLAWSAGSGSSMESHAKNWERMEIRYADAVHSPWARYMSLATASLVLRLCEHRDKFPETRWRDVMLGNLPKTALNSSSDTSFKQLHHTVSGKRFTALQIQRQFAEMAHALITEHDVLLPQDEVEAVYEWLRICDDLEQVDFTNPDTLMRISDRVEWAARYRAIARRAGNTVINKENKEAVAIDLAWDQIYPSSVAEDKYWRKKQPEFYAKHDPDILDLVFEPPRFTRAFQRGQYLKKGAVVNNNSWTSLSYMGRRIDLLDPYDFGGNEAVA